MAVKGNEPPVAAQYWLAAEPAAQSAAECQTGTAWRKRDHLRDFGGVGGAPADGAGCSRGHGVSVDAGARLHDAAHGGPPRDTRRAVQPPSITPATDPEQHLASTTAAWMQRQTTTTHAAPPVALDREPHSCEATAASERVAASGCGSRNQKTPEVSPGFFFSPDSAQHTHSRRRATRGMMLTRRLFIFLRIHVTGDTPPPPRAPRRMMSSMRRSNFAGFWWSSTSGQP